MPTSFQTLMVLVIGWILNLPAAARATDAALPPEAVVVLVDGRAEFSPSGTDRWFQATTNIALRTGDSFRTAAASRAALRMHDQTVLQLGELSQLRLGRREERLLIQLLRGLLYLFHREAKPQLDVESPGLNAAILGTDVAFESRTADTTRVTLYDGQVRLSTRSGERPLHGGQQTTVGDRDDAPVPVPARDFSALRELLKPPLVLVPQDLGIPQNATAITVALRHLALGDPRAALESLPAPHAQAPDVQKFLHHALSPPAHVPSDLAGQFQTVSPGLRRLQAALDDLQHLTTFGPAAGDPISPASFPAPLATEWLVRSLQWQARARLANALDAAREAVRLAPDAGVAHARVAELALALGRIREAQEALDRARTLSPVSAPAWTLSGFVAAAAGRWREAAAHFDHALTLDAAHTDARLGRGLVRIRSGDLVGGRDDLLLAAALAPQRALLRSYLAKAFAESAFPHTTPDAALAFHELAIAARIDPADPTPWLYRGLLHQQGNEINDGLRDLQQSLDRNDARALFRSTLGLDQDRAVRSVNQARLFGDAGLPLFAERAATKAVEDDYANGTAHLFLAHSHDLRRDPRRIQLRHETPWFSEFLVGNLLSPVGAGALSQTVANQEFSRLFERDRFGWASDTTWTSDGDWSQRASQHGRDARFEYAVDATYLSRAGQARDDDAESIAFALATRWQASPYDDLLLQVAHFDSESGDLRALYDPDRTVAGRRFEETHEPLAHIGWHHTWNPGHHSLVLVSPWSARLDYVDPGHQVPYAFEEPSGAATWNVAPLQLLEYRSRLSGVATEFQQIWQSDRHTLVGGTRFQTGNFDTSATLDTAALDDRLPAQSTADPGFHRLGAYFHDRWSVMEGVAITTGWAVDHLRQPVNFRSAPVSEETVSKSWAGPRLGVQVQPVHRGTLRAAWSRSLGGVSFDQSQRLEPTTVAGFNQAYRGLLPESLTGSVAGQEMELLGVAWDQQLGDGLWITWAVERLVSEATRVTGGYRFPAADAPVPSGFPESFEFTEQSLRTSMGYLLGRHVTLALDYRLSRTDLEREWHGAFVNRNGPDQDRSILHHLHFGMRYHHPKGLFAAAGASWFRQSLHASLDSLPTESFGQVDVSVGWRLFQRRIEFELGLRNLTDTEGRIHPLAEVGELPRRRTGILSARFAF